MLCTKTISLVKVLWKNHTVEEASWEQEDKMKSKYPKLFVNEGVGSKNSAAPTHFIQGPRPMPRRKKCPRMNKESPSCQETSPRTILSSANRNCKKEERHALKDSLSGHPKQKGLAKWASHRSKVNEQFQENVTFALSAHS